MTCTQAVDVLRKSNVLIAPTKAACTGGVWGFLSLNMQFCVTENTVEAKFFEGFEFFCHMYNFSTRH
ncbi:hypothetical protein C5167_002043 [Papaver somniferum]|uniref:Uncharacterized protein n=1 Tax=Papaver somniferum TaxID=3469 RepID=A0A4Y7KTN8_PAPSO|nr:hypothetical protein C5167_002043 [Papaver somniferum]